METQYEQTGLCWIPVPDKEEAFKGRRGEKQSGYLCGLPSSRSPRWRGGCVAQANLFFVSVLYTPHLIIECLSVLRERHLLCGSSGGFFYFSLLQGFFFVRASEDRGCLSLYKFYSPLRPCACHFGLYNQNQLDYFVRH